MPARIIPSVVPSLSLINPDPPPHELQSGCLSANQIAPEVVTAMLSIDAMHALRQPRSPMTPEGEIEDSSPTSVVNQMNPRGSTASASVSGPKGMGNWLISPLVVIRPIRLLESPWRPGRPFGREPQGAVRAGNDPVRFDVTA